MLDNIDPNFIIAAVMFIILDIVTGVLAALITGTFKSSTMRTGGLRKLFLTVVICFGACIDVGQNMVDLGISIPACSMICGYICLMEIMSCVENINKAFPTALPKALTNVLSAAASDKGVDTDETSK